MKPSVFANLAVIGIVLASGIVGCKKGQKNPTPIPGGRVGGVGPEAPLDGRPLATNEPPTQYNPNQSIPLPPTHVGWKEDRDTFSAQTIYFDLDKSVVKASEMAKVEAVATRLKTEA